MESEKCVCGNKLPNVELLIRVTDAPIYICSECIQSCVEILENHDIKVDAICPKCEKEDIESIQFEPSQEVIEILR